MNTPDTETGETPLHLAVKFGNISIIKTLVSAKASLEHLDHQGNSVFHYAASTNKDIIMVNILYVCVCFVYCYQKSGIECRREGEMTVFKDSYGVPSFNG